MRYQMVLMECPGTAPRAWGKAIHEAPTILGLWDIAGWRGLGTSADQQFVIKDTKTGNTLSEGEYRALVNRLKGWLV